MRILCLFVLLLAGCAQAVGVSVSSVGGTGFGFTRSYEVMSRSNGANDPLDDALRRQVDAGLKARGLTAEADGRSAYLVQIGFDRRPTSVGVGEDGTANKAWHPFRHGLGGTIYRFEIHFIDRVSGLEIYRAIAEDQAGDGTEDAIEPKLVEAALRQLPFLDQGPLPLKQRAARS